ncbi:MAG TPA: GDSL-type esterase/lipase family protein [Chitinophagaceae bacterium]|nr:GDSL-type esterase/lipase family protein [Chitinophagaceae bacterium]
MKKKLFTVASFLVASLLSVNVFAQSFKDEIDAFKKLDNATFPAKHQILFEGSSSFRKWTDVQQYFPSHKIINRGFGGSTLPDVIRYADEIIFSYQPKQIIIYCGENDIASSDTITAQIVLKRYRQLFFLIRSKLKNVEIDFVSIKPSPSRIKFLETVKQSNQLIKDFIAAQKNAKFINVFDAMLNADGSIKQEIFVEDNLHMNAKGYAIWQKIIEPYLKK